MRGVIGKHTQVIGNQVIGNQVIGGNQFGLVDINSFKTRSLKYRIYKNFSGHHRLLITDYQSDLIDMLIRLTRPDSLPFFSCVDFFMGLFGHNGSRFNGSCSGFHHFEAAFCHAV